MELKEVTIFDDILFYLMWIGLIVFLLDWYYKDKDTSDIRKVSDKYLYSIIFAVSNIYRFLVERLLLTYIAFITFIYLKIFFICISNNYDYRNLDILGTLLTNGAYIQIYISFLVIIYGLRILINVFGENFGKLLLYFIIISILLSVINYNILMVLVSKSDSVISTIILYLHQENNMNFINYYPIITQASEALLHKKSTLLQPILLEHTMLNFSVLKFFHSFTFAIFTFYAIYKINYYLANEKIRKLFMLILLIMGFLAASLPVFKYLIDSNFQLLRVINLY